MKSSLPLVVSVGGNYSCVLDVLLAGHIGFNVSDSVKILCKFFIGVCFYYHLRNLPSVIG